MTLLIGVVIGLVIGAVVTVKFLEKEELKAAAPEKPKAPSNVPKPRFDFYKLLQESETIVPASETPNREETPKTVQADTNEYILQVGSFPTNADADRLRAQLILLGLDARIETVEIRKGEVWHRVVVGPFKAQADLNKAKSGLVAEGYNALVLKRAKTR